MFLEKCINLSAIRTDKNRCGDVCYKMKTHQIPAAVLYHVSPKKRKKKTLLQLNPVKRVTPV